jgi:hypothetical protein
MPVTTAVSDLCQHVADELDERGFAVARGLVPPPLVAALIDASDQAVAAEAHHFPPGDPQHGRALFAPSYGGAFLELCAFDPLFEPIEHLLGADSILYSMTTSILEPGSAGPIFKYHVDLAPDRPDGLALSALVLLDPFSTTNGATEILTGSHRWGDVPLDDSLSGDLLTGEPGDVCYFDPRVRHRTTLNTSQQPRRAVPLQVVRPWMKQRVDVKQMLDEAAVAPYGPNALRRAGITSTPVSSVEEFVARRSARPW